MKLSLEQYDREVGVHLAAIRHHADALLRHVRSMTHQPDFATLAHDDMVRVHDVLAHALDRVHAALHAYTEKPHDRSAGS